MQEIVSLFYAVPAGFSEWLGRLPWADIVVVLFFVALGGSLGSFLNVVAHRLPRGESVVFGGSRCPACGAAIRTRDNIPVLGWLLLCGHCRDCNAPIAIRYPLVEAASATLVGIVASVEVLSGGANLPMHSGQWNAGRRGIDLLLFDPDWHLLGICLLHCATLLTLLAWAIVEHDGQTVPRRWLQATLLLVVVAAMRWPSLQPVGLVPQVPEWFAAMDWRRGLVVSAAGIAVGWLSGWLVCWLTSMGQNPPGVKGCLMLIGATLGWQAAITIAVFLTVVCVVRVSQWGRPSAGGIVQRPFMAMNLVLSAAFYLLLWRWIVVATAVGWQWLGNP